MVAGPFQGLLKERAVWGREGAPFATSFLDIRVVCTGLREKGAL